MLLTDGWSSYRSERIGAAYDHVPTIVKGSGRQAHEVLPGIHRVFALLDRVLKGTYQGAVRRKHLAGYLDEFAFRFNRRNVGGVLAQPGWLFRVLLRYAMTSGIPKFENYPPDIMDGLTARTLSNTLSWLPMPESNPPGEARNCHKYRLP